MTCLPLHLQRKGQHRIQYVIAVFAILIAPLAATSVRAAETVHLYLTANGVVIQGDSSQVSLGRENSIECVEFTHAIQASIDPRSGLTTSERTFAPIVIRKRIDRSTPLLYKAMANREDIRAMFKFFRPNPTGDGTTEQFYTIQLRECRISRIQEFVPDCIDPTSSNYPPQEDVEFVYRYVVRTYVPTGVSFEDSLPSPAVAGPSGFVVGGTSTSAPESDPKLAASASEKPAASAPAPVVKPE